MTQYAPRSMPCFVCKTTMVKFGGATGMCIACRAADPAMAEVQRENRRKIKAEMKVWIERNSVPDPLGRPGVRLMKPDALFGPKRKRK